MNDVQDIITGGPAENTGAAVLGYVHTAYFVHTENARSHCWPFQRTKKTLPIDGRNDLRGTFSQDMRKKYTLSSQTHIFY